jgi:hypothetical protein
MESTTNTDKHPCLENQKTVERDVSTRASLSRGSGETSGKVVVSRRTPADHHHI